MKIVKAPKYVRNGESIDFFGMKIVNTNIFVVSSDQFWIWSAFAKQLERAEVSVNASDDEMPSITPSHAGSDSDRLVEFWVDDVVTALREPLQPLEYVYMWVIEMMLHKRIVLKALYRHPKVMDLIECAIKRRACYVRRRWIRIYCKYVQNARRHSITLKLNNRFATWCTATMKKLEVREKSLKKKVHVHCRTVQVNVCEWGIHIFSSLCNNNIIIIVLSIWIHRILVCFVVACVSVNVPTLQITYYEKNTGTL